MLKHLSLFAAAAVLAAGPVHAQEQEAVLHYIDVSGAAYDFVLATPKPGGDTLPDLASTPDALIVHLPEGALALTFEDVGKMMQALDLLQSPVFTARLETKGSDSTQPVALYVVPKNARRAKLGAARSTVTADK